MSLCEYPAMPPSSRAIHILLCVPSDRGVGVEARE